MNFNLDEIANGWHNLTREDDAIKARQIFKLDQLDKSQEQITITCSDNIWIISQKFIEVLFQDSIKTLGYNFFEKYHFNLPDKLQKFVMEQLEYLIQK